MNPYRTNYNPGTVETPRRWYQRRMPAWLGALIIVCVASGVQAQTPPLRVNGVKFGTNDGSIYLRAYGCKGDGSTDDSTCFTNAVAALTAGSTLVVTPGNYKVTGPFAIPVSNVTIMGQGVASSIITMGTANKNIFTDTSHGGLVVKDVGFVGIGGAAQVASNSALWLVNMTDVLVERCSFTNFQWYAVQTSGNSTARIKLKNNDFVGNTAYMNQGPGPVEFTGNNVRDSQYANTVFVIPLQFDSTSSGFNSSTDLTVANNRFVNWPASQCIEMHTANKATVTGNLTDNCYIGISVNTFQAGDVGQDVTIAGNTVIASSTSGISSAQPSINVGGLAGATVQHVNITGNHVLGGNAISALDYEGCIAVAGTVTDVLIADNTLESCTGNGITLTGPNNNRMTVLNNHIHNVLASAGAVRTGIGVWNNTTQDGYIANNDIDGPLYGVRIDVNTSGGIKVGWNDMTNTTTRVLNPTNGTVMQFADGALATGANAFDLSGSSGAFKFPTGGITNAPIFGAGVTASGAVAFDLSGSTGAFKFPTGGITNTPLFSLGLTAGGATAFDFSGSSGAFKFPTGNVTNTPVFTVGLQVTAGQAIDTSASGTLPLCNNHCTTVTSGTSAVTNTTFRQNLFTLTQNAVTSGTTSLLTLTPGAHTGLTASTENVDENHNLSRTVQWAAGALGTQRFSLYQAPTIAFASGSNAVTTAATLDITGAPVCGTNCSGITNANALRIEAGGVNLAEATVSQATNVNTNVTVNGASVVITTQSASTAARTAETGFTVTDNAVAAASVVNCKVVAYSGTLFTNGQPDVDVTAVSAGSFAVRIINRDATNALSGTMKLHCNAL